MNMPPETKQAIEWALNQTFDYGDGDIIQVSKETSHELVDKVREYFNDNNIDYGTFSYEDLKPYLN